jgi:hypothetical protein
METQSEVVQTATNQEGDKPREGDRRWSFTRRFDGLFTHYEETYIDLYDHGGGLNGYWTRSHASGLFEDAESAMEDALESLTWLADRLSAD